MELRLKAKAVEGRLSIDLPPDWPEGEVDVVVSQLSPVDAETRNRELFAWLDQLHAAPDRTTRTREEIDVELQAERDSWD